jgi:hypothetical protein
VAHLPVEGTGSAGARPAGKRATRDERPASRRTLRLGRRPR